MALFIDGPPITLEDLAAHDTQLLEVAKTEGIDVGRKIALAHDEVVVELSALLSRASPATRLDNVVLTPPLTLWNTYKALEFVYRDAYNSNLNERYAGKCERFRVRAAWAREKLTQLGVGVVYDPIPQAATPDVSPAEGVLNPGVYYASAGWVNRSGETGCCSVPAATAVEAGGIQLTPKNPPANAIGWNAYIGTCAEDMRQQNAAPIPCSQTWIQSTPIDTNGVPAATGQQPVYFEPAPRVIQRG